jgi:sugar phosphate isomerase/epimerase
MIRPGLTSVTFRRLAPEEIVRWAAEAKLAAIEWGGDIHVPPGDLAAARRAADLTRAAGLEVASYGSYYRLGQEPPDLFARVLETAIALGAPIIRVWAGRLGSESANAAFRTAVAEDGRRIADMAAAEGLRIATEWHGNTLTDTAASASALFDAVGHPALCTYWQPRSNLPPEECLRDFQAALPCLTGLHVFHWSPEGRLPLAAGEAAWKRYLAAAAGAGDMFAHLEFVIGDDPRQMLSDAATLRGWLSAI